MNVSLLNQCAQNFISGYGYHSILGVELISEAASFNICFFPVVFGFKFKAIMNIFFQQTLFVDGQTESKKVQNRCWRGRKF